MAISPDSAFPHRKDRLRGDSRNLRSPQDAPH
jgi:hypothetical protein